MRVILEAQHACTPTPRGIPVYTIELIRSLLKRNAFDYSISFFDKNRERNNRQYIDRYFGGYNVPIYECNTDSYKDLMDGDKIYLHKSYDDIIGASGDVFHFLHIVPFPSKVNGKVVITVHDLLPMIFPELFDKKVVEQFNYTCNKILEKKPCLVADSKATKYDVFNILKYDNVQIVPLGYDRSCFYYDTEGALPDTMNITSPYLFYCGALDMRKNILRIIEAFEKISAEFPKLTLVLAGAAGANAGPILKYLEENNNDRIKIVGYVTDNQKRILMSNATAFIFPSLYEGFGLPILEAMACGCPVITSNVSSMPEVAGDAALYVDPYDKISIANACYRVITSEALRSNMIEKGFAQSRKFSWDKTAETMEQIYEKLL